MNIETPAHYPDLTKREDLTQLRKGDVLADPTKVYIENIRSRINNGHYRGGTVRLPVRKQQNAEDRVDEILIDKNHLILQKTEDINETNPNRVTTAGEVIENNPELANKALESAKLRTEEVSAKIWEQLKPQFDKEFNTPEQVENFLRNHINFIFEIPEKVAKTSPFYYVTFGKEIPQEKFDQARRNWFEKEVLGNIKKRIIKYLTERWDIKATVPRWSSSRHRVRNKLCQGDTLITFKGKPSNENTEELDIERAEVENDAIQRNFNEWVKNLEVKDSTRWNDAPGKCMINIYLPSFIPDQEWIPTEHEPSQYMGLMSLEVTRNLFN